MSCGRKRRINQLSLEEMDSFTPVTRQINKPLKVSKAKGGGRGCGSRLVMGGNGHHSHGPHPYFCLPNFPFSPSLVDEACIYSQSELGVDHKCKWCTRARKRQGEMSKASNRSIRCTRGGMQYRERFRSNICLDQIRLLFCPKCVFFPTGLVNLC